MEAGPQGQEQLVDDCMNTFKMEAMDRSLSKVKLTYLTSEILDEAEKSLCRLEQKRYYSHEITRLQAGSYVAKSSNLHMLDPVLVDGLLRIGGRLDRADISYDSKHQVILPAESHISKLIID